MHSRIEIIGARTHNLKNISCSFEHGTLNVITGVSGSGKSSLAFDTLYAEGQRRYVESLSTYARQFLERMERPDIDSIRGVQPAIALEQKNGVRSARSTVGSATEIHDLLRLIFSKMGTTICPDCKREVRAETPESVTRTLEEMADGTRMIVLAPTDLIGSHLDDKLVAEMIRAGYYRLWDGRAIVDLEAGDSPDDPHGTLWILIDRIVASASNKSRLHASLQTAFTAGRGRAEVLCTESGETFRFSSGMACDGCGREFAIPEPALFSFYSPLGACPDCEGFGRVMELDLDKVIPNRDLSLEDGAIAPWNSTGNLEMYDKIKDHTKPAQIPRFKPIADFSLVQLSNLIDGCGRFVGIRGYFNWLESKKYKVQARVMLARYRAYRRCPKCRGTRLVPEALNVLYAGRTIAEIAMLPVRLVLEMFEKMELSARDREIGGRIYEALLGRLRFLDRVGLDYLTLDRATRTLSGGEAQRINLATSLGSGLTQTLYVLDEPTVGLHPRDTERLISVLESLRDLGNTVVVVEHDLDVIARAEHIIDLGPGAGENGGEVLFAGSLSEMSGRTSPTARHMQTIGQPVVPAVGRKPTGWISIKGARGNNLANVNVRFPLGCFCCVTGVSGSGKTTLVRDTLVAAYRRQREIAPVEIAPYRSIEGLEQIRELHWIDQTPLARSKRSNALTYVKAFDAIRQTLASSREARAAGLTPRHFSFNVDAGRCATCQGSGTQTIDMHFMADVEIVCETCDGQRFQSQVLRVRWRGKNICDILQMTVTEAGEFFADHAKVVRALRPLREVGLGYLRLGQSTSTLSGGEAQRLKLAAHLATIRDGAGKLFVFDEPTTGLHAADLERLLAILHQLIERGCSLIVIEHNLDLIASADYVIDLGPDGGDRGGRIVARGPLGKIMAETTSLTGQYLKKRFGDSIAT